MNQFGYVALGSSMHGEESLEAVAGAYGPALAALGGRRIGLEDAERPGPLAVLVMTGGTEREVLELWRRRRQHDAREPLLLIAHPGNNSLPASLEALARAQQLAFPGRILYLQGPGDEAGLRRLGEGLDDLRVREQLRRARVGLIGEPSDWLVASSPDTAVIREQWGPEIVPIAIEALLEQVELAGSAPAAQQAEELRGGARAMVEPDAGTVEQAARVYLALKGLVEKESLSALSVRCFDLVTRLRTTGCFALAQLNDEGVIAGCEGDLATAVTMLWSHLLLGELPWMANPSRLDESANTLWLAHCTVPRGLTQGYRLRSHFESGLGVALEGEMAAGPVTLLRVGGVKLDRLWVSEGELLRSGDCADLCRTQVEVSLKEPVSSLLREPLGNHLTLVRGHHARRLRGWWESMRG